MTVIEERERVAENIFDIIMFMDEAEAEAVIDAINSIDSEIASILRMKYF